MAAAAVPLATTVAGAIASKYFGGAPKNTPAGAAAQAGLTQNAGLLRGIGQAQTAAGSVQSAAGGRMLDTASSNINGAANYFRTLAGGNSAATAAAIAPQVGQITQAYRGATSALDRGGVRGPIRDVAESEMARERAGTISGLVLAQRPNAINSLIDIERGQQQIGLQRMGYGQGATSLGVGALGGSSGPLGAIYGQEARRAEVGDQNKAAIGKFFANLIYDYMRNYGSKAAA